MIPILFDKTATVFTSNGVGRLVDCISCKVTEERNGIYELEMQYPVTGKWFSNLFDMGIIGVIHDDAHDIQPFDIYKITAPLNGVVTVFAHHISYRLNNYIVYPFTAASASAAVAAIATNCVNATLPFTFSTDKSVSSAFTLDAPKSIRSLLMGEQGSLLDVYGKADYKFDKFAVSMLVNRGSATGVTVRYGKNMTGVERVRDKSGVFSCAIPFWTNGETVVKTDVSDPIVYPTTPVTPYVPALLDLSQDFESEPTEQQLRDAAQAYLDSEQPWLGSDTIKVDFVAMWQTPEYESVAEIQRVSLCDTVSIYNTELGIISENGKIVKVVFNVLSEMYDSIEIGTISKKFVAITGESIAAQVNITSVVAQVLNSLPSVGITSSDDGAGTVTLAAAAGELRSSDDGNGNVTIQGGLT